MRRIGLAFVVVVALLLALPALAAAEIEVEVEGTSLTVTGDDQPDQVRLSVGPTGKLAVNDEETTLARGRALITIETGAGNDTLDAGVLAPTDYTAMVVRGGAGNDILTGGNADDTFIWENGDNNDEVIGAAGRDALDLSGHPTAADNLSFRPSTRQPGWVLIVRQATAAVAPFELEALDIETTSINTLGGDDFTANDGPVGIGTLTQLVIHGDVGNDTLGGSSGGDEIDGGLGDDLVAGAKGDDRLFGAAGTDRLFGEEGDDRMFWANGDGRDEDTGGAGSDEVRLSGHPTLSDVLAYRPNAARPGWVFLHRLEPPDGSVKAFEIELLEVETFSIDTMGGRDKVEGEGLQGVGDLTNLDLQGGFGDDELAASDGDDRISGGPGEDLLFDGPGDDTINWRPGDGDDEVRASPNAPLENDALVAIGSEAADDFRLSRENGVTKLAGAAAGPFEIATGAAAGNGSLESFTIVGEGGPDEILIEPGMPEIRVLAAGGDGRDRLTGGDEADFFRGGAQTDALSGEGGEDILLARDGEADDVDGGAGVDAAETDALSLDTVIGVENLDARNPGDPEDPGPEDPGPKQPGPEVPRAPAPPQPPAPDKLALLPSLGQLSLAQGGKSLVATVPLACPAAEAGGCRTTVTVETAKAVRLNGRKAILRLGSAKTDLAPGATAMARVRLNRRAAALLERGKLPVRVRIASTDAAGNAASSSLTRVLKPR